jgi:hypothetical protein
VAFASIKQGQAARRFPRRAFVQKRPACRAAPTIS